MSKKINVEYVYAGAMLHEDQLVHSYIRINDDGALADPVVYAKQMSKHKCGSVIKFAALDTPDNLIAGTGLFLRVWENRKQVLEWTAMSTSIMLSEEAYTKALGKPSSVMEALEPLRVAYAKLKDRERAVLLAQISAYIVSEE